VALIIIAVPVAACVGVLMMASTSSSVSQTGAARPIERPKAPGGEGL
jgi:hypothetical protein